MTQNININKWDQKTYCTTNTTNIECYFVDYTMPGGIIEIGGNPITTPQKIPCQYCGQWGEARSTCSHCGAPIQ